MKTCDICGRPSLFGRHYRCQVEVGGAESAALHPMISAGDDEEAEEEETSYGS